MLKSLIAAQSLPRDQLDFVINGLRERGLLGNGGLSGGRCAREQLGDELFDALQLVCSRTDFFGSFDHDTLVSLCCMLICVAMLRARMDAKTRFFDSRSRAQAQVLECATAHQVTERELIFLQQDRADSMFVILRGSVALFEKRPKDAEHAPGEVVTASDDAASQPDTRAEFRAVESNEKVPASSSGVLAIIDWQCEYDMNRWKRYHCELYEGLLTWSESKHATATVGEIKLCDATTCAKIDRHTVGYTRIAAMLDSKEMLDLNEGSVFAILCGQQCYLFDAKSKSSRDVWVKSIRDGIPSTNHNVSAEEQDAKKIAFRLSEWRARARKGRAAWQNVGDIFGAPVRHLLEGETFGEVTAALNARAHTALACCSCVIIELNRKMLVQRDLWDFVMPGTMWMSLHQMLRPEPMERRNDEVDYILSAVNYMPFFHQLPPPVRRGFLELCKSCATPTSTVLGQYAKPLTATSSAPLYIVLQGKIEIYAGHMMLKESIRALGNVAFEEMQDLFPRKVLTVHAEEAWGGPQLIQDRGNQHVCRLQQQVIAETDAKKAKALRSAIKEQIDSTILTAVAAEGTNYLRIEQHEWERMFEEVDDYVFRMSTLFRILEKPPQDRTPMDARLSACLLHGFLFFQQLPFYNTLDLAYNMKLVTVDSGIVMAKEGVALDQVLFFVAGTASVHKSRGANNLRLPIGPGKSVTLEDARVFFGPVEYTVEAGHSFGTDTLYSDPPVPAHSLVASSTCHVVQILADDYRAHIGKYAQAFTPVEDSIFAIIAKPAEARNQSESHALLQCLRHVGILRDCPDGLLNELKNYLTVESAERGDILAAQGDTTPTFKIVVGGSASIHSHDSHEMDDASPSMSDQGPSGPLSMPTPTDLCMKWGMCTGVVEVGGSFGELVIATGLPRKTTLIARGKCRLLSIYSERLPPLVFGDLKDFILLSQGVPVGLRKSRQSRSEHDVVKVMGFLSTFDYFKGHPQAAVADLAGIAEFRSYGVNESIQDDSTRGTFIYLVHGGKVQVEKQKDVSKMLLVASPTRQRGRPSTEALKCVSLSTNVARDSLELLATGVFPHCEAVRDVMAEAVKKSAQLLSPAKKRSQSKQKIKRDEEGSRAEGGKQRHDTGVLGCGEHFVLGRATALESAQLLRLDWAQTQAVLLQGQEDALKTVVSFLARTKPFACWKPKMLNALAQRTQLVKFSRNSVVVAKGQALTAMVYIVKSGSCSLHGTVVLRGSQGVDMLTDDKLYRTSRPNAGSGDAQTSRKLFRCPNCASGSLRGGSLRSAPSPAHKAYAICALCQGTGTIRSDALKKSGATLAYNEQQVDVSLGAITAGSVVNAALDQTGSPLEHSILADNSCELYAITIQDLLEVCDGSQAMLKDLKAECLLMEDWHSHRKSAAQGAHSKLQEQGELLLHPRPQEDYGGETPNQSMLEMYHALPTKSWSKAFGSTSWSRSGAKASKLLNTPQRIPMRGADSPEKMSMGEKRSATLGIHNMQKIKAKYDAAAAEQSAGDDPGNNPGRGHDATFVGGQSSQVLRTARTPYTPALIEEGDEEEDQVAQRGEKVPRRIEHVLAGQYRGASSADSAGVGASRTLH